MMHDIINLLTSTESAGKCQFIHIFSYSIQFSFVPTDQGTSQSISLENLSLCFTVHWNRINTVIVSLKSNQITTLIPNAFFINLLTVWTQGHGEIQSQI